MKKAYLFIFSLILFSFLIFILKSYFFGYPENNINQYIEDTYIDPSIKYENTSNKLNKNIEGANIQVSLKSAYNINFIYFPEGFSKDSLAYARAFKIFLNNSFISNKIDDLNVEIHKMKNDVRGKMKDRSVKLFGVKKDKLSEYLSVGIHEFAHFVDIYFFKRGIYNDISNNFYEISWENTKTMKSGQEGKDFVSGYSMTNKYEDFAETFTYFVLHNKDFLEKSKKSRILKNKYIFFTKYLFKNKEFIGTDFSENNKIKLYYRDITKINFSLENFLIFLKK